MSEIKKFQDICKNCPQRYWVSGAVSVIAIGTLIKMRTGKSDGTDEAIMYCSQHSESCPTECGCVMKGVDPEVFNLKVKALSRVDDLSEEI